MKIEQEHQEQQVKQAKIDTLNKVKNAVVVITFFRIANGIDMYLLMILTNSSRR